MTESDVAGEGIEFINALSETENDHGKSLASPIQRELNATKNRLFGKSNDSEKSDKS